MEAASGGYVEVGHVLIERGADVNAPPVPSSRDTALTIAADKGHYKFVELLLSKHASVEVKSKKGCSPAWLAANGMIFTFSIFISFLFASYFLSFDLFHLRNQGKQIQVNFRAILRNSLPEV